MRNDTTYHEAFAALELLILQIEAEEIQLDVLADKIQEGNALIAFCENKLRGIEIAVAASLDEEKGSQH